jgi:hypothetical protein
MNRSVRTWMLLAVIIFCLVIFFLPTSVGQDRKTYEVPAQVYGVPAWRSDAAHAVDAYERLMQRYTDLTERTMAGMAADLNGLARRLDAIDAKLTALDTRLARIEQHLYPASVSAATSISPLGQRQSAIEPASNHPDMKGPAPVAGPPPVPVPPTSNSSPAPDTMP